MAVADEGDPTAAPGHDPRDPGQRGGAIYRNRRRDDDHLRPGASPIDVTIDATHFWWTNDYLRINAPAGTIASKSLDCGAMTTLATRQDTPQEVVVGVSATGGTPV